MWQTALQQRRTEHHHEDVALQQWTTSVQSRVSVCVSGIRSVSFPFRFEFGFYLGLFSQYAHLLIPSH